MTLNITKTFVKYTQLTVGTMIYRKIAMENWSGTHPSLLQALYFNTPPRWRRRTVVEGLSTLPRWIFHLTSLKNSHKMNFILRRKNILIYL